MLTRVTFHFPHKICIFLMKRRNKETFPFQNFTESPHPTSQSMNVSSRRGSGGRRVVSGAGGWSGTSYDVMSYQEAARSGQIQVSQDKLTLLSCCLADD